MIALAVVAGVVVVMLGVQQFLHARERVAWSDERIKLVNRIIAKSSGEVVALDHQDRRNHAPDPLPEREPILTEGLS